MLTEFKVSGSVIIIFEKEKNNDSFELFIEDATLKGDIWANNEKDDIDNILSLLVRSLVLSFRLENKDWTLKTFTKNFNYDISYFIPSNTNNNTGYFYGEMTERACSPQYLKMLGYSPTHCYEKFIFEKHIIKAVSSPFYVFSDGTLSNGKIFYNPSLNYKFTVTGDDWEGNRIWPDGTKVSKEKRFSQCFAQFPDGSKFSGTLKKTPSSTNTLYPIMADAIIDKTSMCDGQYMFNGKMERLISGQSRSALHQRITSLYDEDLVARIESGSLSESDAAITQQERDRIKEDAQNKILEKVRHNGSSVLPSQPYPIKVETGDWYHPRYLKIYHRSYDNRLVESTHMQIQSLLEKDAAGYYHIDGVSTPLQRKVFNQSEDCKTIIMPMMEKELNNLREDEYVVEASLEKGMGLGYRPIESLDYDMNAGRFVIEIRDKEYVQNNQNESQLYFPLFNYLCLTYPKNLVNIQKRRNLMDQDVYVLKMKTCKVAEEEAVNFEDYNQLKIRFTFKIVKVKNDKIYGKTTGIQLVCNGTCDLTRTLSTQ